MLPLKEDWKVSAPWIETEGEGCNVSAEVAGFAHFCSSDQYPAVSELVTSLLAYIKCKCRQLWNCSELSVSP